MRLFMVTIAKSSNIPQHMMISWYRKVGAGGRELYWSLVYSPHRGPVMWSCDVCLSKLLKISWVAGDLRKTNFHVTFCRLCFQINTVRKAMLARLLRWERSVPMLARLVRWERSVPMLARWERSVPMLARLLRWERSVPMLARLLRWERSVPMLARLLRWERSVPMLVRWERSVPMLARLLRWERSVPNVGYIAIIC